jgi:DNA helicase-2/ATP-dependent DNA helicase PcrA
MKLDAFHKVLARREARGYELNDEQRRACDHATGPLWILAGPGSGKSEVLVTRTLRLLCVDREDPASVLLTTFTEKASRNLQDRLASYLIALQNADAGLKSVDLANLRVGTLHGLCNKLLQEFRHGAYQNVRLLDEVEQHLFVYRFAEIADCADVGFWRGFEDVVSRWSAAGGYPPNKWQRARAAVVLFNHLVEDVVDLGRMHRSRGNWDRLATFYEQYRTVLRDQHRCDFSHLQAVFLDFLGTPASRSFLHGDAQKQISPLRHVLVDEYQDTNPIQERIYLALAGPAPHNLTVVGDDDQALYRFRGGTVACMVNFDRACAAAQLGPPTQVELTANYRSHPDIVHFYSRYISSFPEMNEPGVRAPGKKGVAPHSGIAGDYPAVSWVSRTKAADLPAAVADVIQHYLLGDQVITDLSQCVLLLRSARDSVRNAGPFLDEFRRRNIPVYNPRSKSFLESEEVQCLLGALIHVVDQDLDYASMKSPSGQDLSWRSDVDAWIARLAGLPAASTTKLRDYIRKSQAELARLCAASKIPFLGLNLLEILYRILSLEPFATWRQDPSRNLRLSKVTRLFESYGSFNLGTLRADPARSRLDATFLRRFYHMFIGYLVEAGVNDDEDDDVIAPRGYLPIMTVHQSKGLEFPFVIVAQVGNKGTVGAGHTLERDLARFRQDFYNRGSRAPELLMLEDDLRLLYVAYSRAQYGLILVGTPNQIKNHVAAPNRDFTEFRRTVLVI